MNTSYFAPRPAPARVPEHLADARAEPGKVLSKPLWQLLNVTAKSVHEVMLGKSATAVLLGLDPSFKPGVQALLFLTLRKWGLAKALRAHFVPKKPAPPMDHLLCTCLALMSEEEGMPYEPHTLVNQAVQAAKANVNTAGQSAMLNAVLRRFLRERAQALEAVSAQPEAQYNHPLWWIKLLQKDHPKDWAHILDVAQTPAVMSLRVNESVQTRAAYAEALAQRGLVARTVRAEAAEGNEINEVAEVTGLMKPQPQPEHVGSSPGLSPSTCSSALVLERPVGVHLLPDFELGAVSVQDAAAQRAAPLLLGAYDEARLAKLLAQESQAHGPQGPQGQPPTFAILDACAAPGGKTAHLLELLSVKNQGEPLALRGNKDWRVEVHAVEIDDKRAQKVVESLDRARLQARVWVGDASSSSSSQASSTNNATATAHWRLLSGPSAKAPPQRYQAILLDAPCSASGIVRRHPDIRWLRRAEDIPRLFETQSQLLKQLWSQLVVGGVLLYCTCSVFKDEGERQINSFLKHNSDAFKLPSPGHLIPQKTVNEPTLLDNQASDQDGFYYALLQKNASE